MIKAQLALNWLAVVLIALGEIMSTFSLPSNAPFLAVSGLLASSPYVSALIAARASGRGAIGALAIGLNCLFMVPFGGLAAVAFTGLAGAFGVFPFFLGAVALCGLNVLVLIRSRRSNARQRPDSHT